jgi:uncharacterized membrane protein YgcG
MGQRKWMTQRRVDLTHKLTAHRRRDLKEDVRSVERRVAATLRVN